jgi:hypothetical protein
MFEVGNIIKWTKEKRERMIPFLKGFRFKITSISEDGLKITIQAISDENLINLLTEPSGIVRDIEYERSIKLKRVRKNKMWWNIFKKK